MTLLKKIIIKVSFTEDDVHTKTLRQMFLAALFIIAKTCKQPSCPSRGEWISKLWYIQMMEYYSATTKQKELSSHENTCRKLKMHITK